MTFSVARYRHLKPSPPFALGGEFLRSGARCFIKDALTHLEITAEGALFADFQDGDLMEVHVDELRGTGLQCSRADRLWRGRRPRRVVRGGRSADFANFTRVVRDFFIARGLLEVFTPTLVPCPGLEPSLEPFVVEIQKGRVRRTVYLPTSPEIHLKKALAMGFTDLFELKTCFRKGEFSPMHENEFLMLEWYRCFADLELILDDLRSLLAELHRLGFVASDTGFQCTTFAALFAEAFAFPLNPRTTREELSRLCERERIEQAQNDSFNDLFHRIVVDRLEPVMTRQGPLVVRDFPPSQAALARLTPEGWADRFEFYWNGFEIANAFNEVTHPEEQKRRWEDERSERARLGTLVLEGDEGLIAALEEGLPPTGGIALGVERLYMACRGVEDIRKLRLFASTDLFE